MDWLLNLSCLIIVVALVIGALSVKGGHQTQPRNEWSNEKSMDERRAERRQADTRYFNTHSRISAQEHENTKYAKAQLGDTNPYPGTEQPRLTAGTTSGKSWKQIEGETERFWSDPDAARKHLAKIYHPDKNPPEMRELCNEIMKDVNQLADKEKRGRRK